VCLACRAEVALLDLAEPAVRRAHLRGDADLRVTIRTYYGARSAMLMLFVAILFGLGLGLALMRKASLLSGPSRWMAVGGALLIGVLVPAAVAFGGARVVHLFSRSCRRKPLEARDIRVVRKGPSAYEP